MPTYNGEKVIRRALDSVLDENDFDLEVIVIDDGSDDETLSIVNTYSSLLPINIVSRERSRSWIEGTNIGLDAALGEYICFLHQDDFWLPGRLRMLHRMSECYPSASVLVHPSIFVNQCGRSCGKWSCPFGSRERLISRPEVLNHLVVQNFVSIPAPAVRREMAKNAAPLDNSLWFTADWKFWLTIDGMWAYCPQPYSAFRIHQESQTSKYSKNSALFREQLVRASIDFLPLVSLDVQRAALFNIELNILLAAIFHSESCNTRQFLQSVATAGSAGICRAAYSSRIFERTISRIRAGLR